MVIRNRQHLLQRGVRYLLFCCLLVYAHSTEADEDFDYYEEDSEYFDDYDNYESFDSMDSYPDAIGYDDDYEFDYIDDYESEMDYYGQYASVTQDQGGLEPQLPSFSDGSQTGGTQILGKTSVGNMKVGIIGSIIVSSNEPRKKRDLDEENWGFNVALLKIDGKKGSKVVAVRQNMILEGSHRVVSIEEREVELADIKSNKITKVYKEGFIKSVPMRSMVPQLSIDSLSDGNIPFSFREEGFVREGRKVEITNEYKANILKNMGSILMQASSYPVVEDGAIVGFGIDAVQKDSIFEKVGLISGDEIVEIQGEPLNSVSGAVRTLNNLRNSDGASFVIIRDGKEMTFNVGVQ